MKASDDVLAERQRQINAEGWTAGHDDTEHYSGELVSAARCYLHPKANPNDPPMGWPWDGSWWKPTTRRRNLVKAAALILAEIERLDRQGAREQGREGASNGL